MQPASVIASLKSLLFEDNPQWIGPKLVAYLMANPTLAITGLYVTISGLGLLYEIVLFRQFQVDILDYSEAADFFLAAFKRPDALLSSTLILCTIFVYRLIARFAQSLRSTLLRYLLLTASWIGLFRREILIPIAIIYFLFIYALAAQHEARQIVFSVNSTVTIATKTAGSRELSIIPIGATEKMLFGVDAATVMDATVKEEMELIRPRVVAVPFSEIARIEYQNARFNRWGTLPHAFETSPSK